LRTPRSLSDSVVSVNCCVITQHGTQPWAICRACERRGGRSPAPRLGRIVALVGSSVAGAGGAGERAGFGGRRGAEGGRARRRPTLSAARMCPPSGHASPHARSPLAVCARLRVATSLASAGRRDRAASLEAMIETTRSPARSRNRPTPHACEKRSTSARQPALAQRDPLTSESGSGDRTRRNADVGAPGSVGARQQHSGRSALVSGEGQRRLAERWSHVTLLQPGTWQRC
jgi:hypothetical protein